MDTKAFLLLLVYVVFITTMMSVPSLGKYRISLKSKPPSILTKLIFGDKPPNIDGTLTFALTGGKIQDNVQNNQDKTSPPDPNNSPYLYKTIFDKQQLKNLPPGSRPSWPSHSSSPQDLDGAYSSTFDHQNGVGSGSGSTTRAPLFLVAFRNGQKNTEKDHTKKSQNEGGNSDSTSNSNNNKTLSLSIPFFSLDRVRLPQIGFSDSPISDNVGSASISSTSFGDQDDGNQPSLFSTVTSYLMGLIPKKNSWKTVQTTHMRPPPPLRKHTHDYTHYTRTRVTLSDLRGGRRSFSV